MYSKIVYQGTVNGRIPNYQSSCQLKPLPRSGAEFHFRALFLPWREAMSVCEQLGVNGPELVSIVVTLCGA